MTLSLNDRIRADLTPHGQHLYRAYWAKYVAMSPFIKIPDLHPPSYWEGELWDFAQIFGGHLYNGCKQVVVANIVEVLP